MESYFCRLVRRFWLVSGCRPTGTDVFCMKSPLNIFSENTAVLKEYFPRIYIYLEQSALKIGVVTGNLSVGSGPLEIL